MADLTTDSDHQALGAAFLHAFEPLVAAFWASGGTPELLGEALAASGLLVHADCWDAPDVTDRLSEIEVRLGELDEIDDADEWNELVTEQDDLQVLDDRVTVYYEDEDRPAGAVPLWKIGAPS